LVALGATFKANEQLQIDFGYSHLFIDDADADADADVTLPIAGGTGIDNLVGTYKDPKVNIATIQFVYKF